MKYIIVPTTAGHMIKIDGGIGYLACVYKKELAELIVALLNKRNEQ